MRGCAFLWVDVYGRRSAVRCDYRNQCGAHKVGRLYERTFDTSVCSYKSAHYRRNVATNNIFCLQTLARWRSFG